LFLLSSTCSPVIKQPFIYRKTKRDNKSGKWLAAMEQPALPARQVEQ
jgi:hypothetical protein